VANSPNKHPTREEEEEESILSPLSYSPLFSREILELHNASKL
jgi:hypothetical protein